MSPRLITLFGQLNATMTELNKDVIATVPTLVIICEVLCCQISDICKVKKEYAI